jgi:hypothetical protein
MIMPRKPIRPAHVVAFSKTPRTGRVSLVSNAYTFRRGKGKTVSVIGRRRESLIEISCSCFFAYGGGCSLKIRGRSVWCEKASQNPCQGSCELTYRAPGRDTLIIWI